MIYIDSFGNEWMYMYNQDVQIFGILSCYFILYISMCMYEF